ncbi:hypothetical protein HY491_02310 [Candidatus Woesearchaeota archaeon]|nr:hypothetical protein [Candidatus Woesearchaeota archaeon]
MTTLRNRKREPKTRVKLQALAAYRQQMVQQQVCSCNARQQWQFRAYILRSRTGAVVMMIVWCIRCRKQHQQQVPLQSICPRDRKRLLAR